MKKLFLNFTMVLVATSLMLVSCNTKTDGDGVDDPNDSIPAGVQEDLATVLKEQGYTLANAAFGTAYPSYSYIDVYFANEADTVAISFNTDGEETLPVGEYSMDEYIENEDGEMELEYLPGTWDPEYSYWWNAKAAEATEYGVYFFSEGTVSVAKSGRNYAVKIDFVDENGDAIKWAYVGQIELEVYENEEADTSYGEEEAEDFTISPIEATAAFCGDYAGNGTSNYYLQLVDENGGRIMLDIYAVGTGTADAIPNGDYTISDTNAENTVAPGYSDLSQGKIFPSYYFIDKDEDGYVGSGEIFYFVSGTIRISNTEDGGDAISYTIEGAVETALGTAIDFSYTGAISIEDETSSDAATSSVKSVKPVKQGKKLGRRVVRK